MALQFTSVEEPSFSRGIDARSAENQIREGFVRDLVNGDIVEGRIKKRKGYEAFAGNVPLRVVTYRQPEAGRAIVSLDSSIDLSRVEGRPILLYGRTSSTHASPNPFTSGVDRTWWFTDWETNLRKYFNTGSGSITATSVEHSIPSTDMYVGVSENVGYSPSVDTLSGELLTTSIDIDNSTRLITVNYTNNQATNVPVFLYYLDRTTVDGTTYSKSDTTASAGVSTFSVLASAHGLSTSNILYQLYQYDSVNSKWIQCFPDSFTCSSIGDITYSVTADSGVTFRIVLSSVSDSQVVEGGESITLVNQPNSYLFYTCYNGGNEIKPDTVQYDDDEKTVVFTFSGEEVPNDIRICYEYGLIRTNEIYLDDADFGAGPIASPSFSSTFTDSVPQLTLYGIGHDIAYGDNKRNFRRGWVNHIDSYRSPDNVHMVAGLGGNLYAALDAEMPTYYPNLRVRVVSSPDPATFIGPAFGLASSDRSRGVYSFTGSGTGWAKITSVTWTASGTEYVLSLPGKNKIGTPADNTDYLTVKGMSHSRHNGTFKIVSITEAANQLTIKVTNPQLVNEDYNDSGCSGSGGIFTDRFASSVNPNPFLPGDRLLSSSWGDETELSITASNLHIPSGENYISDDIVYLSGCYDVVRLGSNLLITGERTSDTVRFRTVSNIPQVDYLVPGDSVSYSEQDNLLQIVSVDVTNKTVTFDSPITWRDSVTLAPTFTVSHRWLPVEAPTPDVGDTLIPTTSVRYFTSDDYDNQSFLRSAMVQNNLYLTNGKDEVYKYDGTNNYRAGIIPWQPGLFATVYSSPTTGGIALVGGAAISILTASLADGTVQISKTDSLRIAEGSVLLFRNDEGISQYLTVKTNKEVDSSKHSLSFEETLNFTVLGTTPRLLATYSARYYFRLNIKDVNGVVTASAVTGAEDFVVRIAPSTTQSQYVKLRLVGLPAWDQYDFRNKNIEVEIYRTQWTPLAGGGIPVFFRLPQTKVCSFTPAGGYIDIVDTYSNDVLSEGDVVVGSLAPNTIPAAWDEPPRAKYVTTAGNRLVLANITDWPTLSLSYIPKTTASESEFSSQKITFRKSATTSATATDMVNRISYQYINPFIITTGTFSNNSTSIVVASAANLNIGTLVTGTGIAANTTVTNIVGTTVTISTPTTSGGSGATLTFGNYHTITSASYSSGAVTVTCASNHGRQTGDWIYLFRDLPSGEMNTSLCGWWQVTVTSPTTFTFKWTPSSGSASPTFTIANEANHFCHAEDGKDVPVWLGQDANMQMVNGQVVGFPAPEIRIIRRLGMAINATMRMTDTVLHPTFKPWLVARSESDTFGQLIVKQPRAEVTLPAVEITTLSAVDTYVNGSLAAADTIIQAAVTRYPSRIAASYDNYPEIFDNLWTNNVDDSDSVLDINSSDGQEITGIIPFFGDSAFGAAQQSSVLVVFKQNSIYLVDLAAKASGQTSVQRLQTQGLGCTAPYSIAPTRNGIAFANESGIYVLRTNQTIEYLGRYMERNWQEKVDLGALSIAQGHHYGVGRQYKLSVPMAADSSDTYAENGEVYVYNHTGEADGELGGWSRYTNHPVTGWANLFQNAFLATANGSVMRVRSSGGVSDYRDANVAVESILEARAVSFGNTSIRKAVANLVVHYRSGANSENTFVYTSPDLYNEYQLSTLFKVVTKSIQDGLSSTGGQAVVSIMHTFNRRRCLYMGVKITNNGLDENVEIAGMSYIVAGLSGAGVKQAAETT